ncbi:MAG: L,D-transpeptidase family protein [Bacteroidales bacterium]|nr:L,D-transpeptidase family protein [Bacteroidales bacterium]
MRFIIPLIFAISFFACNRNQESEKEVNDNETISYNDSIRLLELKKFEVAQIESSLAIREILENRQPGERYRILDDELYSSVLLPRLYTENEFKPFWTKQLYNYESASQLIEYIENAEFHGLVPTHYHFDALKKLFESLQNDSSQVFNPLFTAHLDLLLSDAFFMLSSHLYHGKIDSESLEAQWGIQRNKPELMLDQKLRLLHNGKNIEQIFKTFYPPYSGYEKMVHEAKRLRSIQVSDFSVSMDPKTLSIKPGETSKDLPAIKKKLNYLGLYEADSLDFSVEYDEKTVKSIQKLQALFGFNTDGNIGKNTLKALNMPVEQKLKQLYVNMERLRWLPDSLEHRYVLANIADFSLFMFEGKDTLLNMRTIVGKDYRETPVFNSKIRYLVFSPSWTVPPGIMQKDIIPAVKKDLNYLSQKNMLVYDSQGKLTDPATINWKRNGMRYTVRQAPGNQNSLGKVKFMFPNKYNVYLHDTPSRELFWRDERTFSSGCIRIEKPFELTKVLLSDMPEWTDEKIKQAMNSGVEKTVVLKSSVGVYLYYLTAWANENGEIHYRSDIYDRDLAVFTALGQKK